MDEKSLASFELHSDMQIFLLTVLLPVMYWQLRLQNVRNPKIKSCYQQAHYQALAEMENHSIYKKMDEHEKNQWKRWGTWIAEQFQRTTSAIEGRNGVLSLASHFCRGISKNRLAALTVIHNYFIRRDDNTTAAQRLYKVKHDCLLEFILENVTELPMPRNWKKDSVAEPLYLQLVAA